ncbi:MAG: hypothetical protein A3E05_00440 [Candidatus Jacksonbacteria bacterium RIFCSPHIGHO2_12_FULL_44_12]|nr:MAG: hypothetical protein A3E05_00440 [Candidatus Jacksonbacteria bacterium RIFCSPHIGHO2_12_FULL_44_12]
MKFIGILSSPKSNSKVIDGSIRVFSFGLLAGVLIEDGGAVGGSVKGFSFFSAQPLVIPNIDKKTIENRIIRFIDFY